MINSRAHPTPLCDFTLWQKRWCRCSICCIWSRPLARIVFSLPRGCVPHCAAVYPTSPLYIPSLLLCVAQHCYYFVTCELRRKRSDYKKGCTAAAAEGGRYTGGTARQDSVIPSPFSVWICHTYTHTEKTRCSRRWLFLLLSPENWNRDLPFDPIDAWYWCYL